MKKKILIILIIGAILFFASSYLIWILTAKPPVGEVATYKGLWMPVISVIPLMHPISFNLEKLKNDGVNILSFGPIFLVNKKGKISNFLWSRHLVIFQIKRLHRAGFKVMLANEVMEKIGVPGFLPLETLNNPDFWINLNKIVVENAKVAEKYGVELYAPLNEPEVKFHEKPERIYQWAQEILPQIKEVYHGKIVWKGAPDLPDQPERAAIYDPNKMNFSGYDYLGFSTGLCDTPEKYQERVERLINFLKPIAERSKTELIVTEFGAWDKPWNQDPENVRRAYEIVLEEGYKNNLKGFFALDGPRGQPNFSVFESVLKKWYEETLP